MIVEARVSAGWMVYVEFDWLARKGPLLSNGLVDTTNLAPVTSRIYRYSIGIVRKFRLGIIWKLEYALWDFDQGAPDAHRISTQVVIPF